METCRAPRATFPPATRRAVAVRPGIQRVLTLWPMTHIWQMQRHFGLQFQLTFSDSPQKPLQSWRVWVTIAEWNPMTFCTKYRMYSIFWEKHSTFSFWESVNTFALDICFLGKMSASPCQTVNHQAARVRAVEITLQRNVYKMFISRHFHIVTIYHGEDDKKCS